MQGGDVIVSATTPGSGGGEWYPLGRIGNVIIRITDELPRLPAFGSSEYHHTADGHILVTIVAAAQAGR